MGDPSESKNEDKWMRCLSKNRPGQYYMFNKESGESYWCTSPNKTQSNITDQPKSKTPAQDRLKRLQKLFEKKQKESSSVVKAKDILKNRKLDLSTEKQSVDTVKDKSLTAKEKSPTKTNKECQESKATINNKIIPQINRNKKELVATKKQNMTAQRDEKKVEPETKSSNKKALKRKPDGIVNGTHLIPKKQIAINSSLSSLNKVTKSNVFIPTPSSPINSSSSGINKNTKSDNGISKKKQIPIKLGIKRDTKNNSSSKNIRTSVNLPADISPATENIVQCDTKNDKETVEDPKLSIMSFFKDYCSNFFKKAKPSKIPTEANNQPSLLLRYKTSCENKQSMPEKSLQKTNLSTNDTSPNLSTKGIANDRLQRLRRSLQNQQTVPNRPQLILSPCSNNLSSSQSNESGCASRTSDQSIEPMDWQPIYEDPPPPPLCNSNSSSLSNTTLFNESTQSEHLNMVNENLLRLAAEKRHKKQAWKTDFFYFVVDTNVFLENVTFVDELTTMKLCDTAGTLIYIPYCVLQELDKLKIHSPSESIKMRTTRAIHFLNKAFQTRTDHIQAQSSADENKHLIKVTSPDDSILNCCLQVKEHIENVMLLTEDINLRNKAMCSDVLVSTKSELISKHESLL